MAVENNKTKTSVVSDTGAYVDVDIFTAVVMTFI
jgi:hypothetical protein